jgi:glycosyltransferase involved in cell wall biosynthesis
VLVIPHVLSHPVRVRGAELARALAARHEVTLLTGVLQEEGISRLGKAVFHARSLLGAGSTPRGPVRPGLRERRLPTLAARVRGAGAVERAAFRLELRRGRFEVIINAACAPGWSVPRGTPGRYILDLVDDHAAGARLHGDPALAGRIDRFHERELPRAHHVTVVSEGLRESFSARARPDVIPVVIPNGAHVARLRAPDAARVARLRSRLELEGRFVFGYIGGMDSYVDVATVTAAFGRVHARHPRARLLWIGDGERYRAREPREGARFLGPVPVEESAEHIALFDVGLIPKTVDAFTDAMMPIKSVEYGAARIAAIASPLAELRRLALPNTRLAPLREADWEAAMLGAIENPVAWRAEHDAVFDAYDWDRIARRFEALFE